MKRKELVDILKKVKPGVASKEIVESMTYFYLSGSDIITYNDRIAIRHPFVTEFSTFVKANDFFNTVSKISSEEINLSYKNGKLSVTSKKFKVDLATIIDDEFTTRINNINESMKDTAWSKLPENFNDGITLCAFAASTSETEQTLSCVYVEKNTAIASDNQRVAKSKLTGSISEPILIKAGEVKNLVSINPTMYSVTNSWIHFRNDDNCIFSIRRIKGNFPDFSAVLNFKGTEVDLPSNLTEGTSIASIFTDDKMPTVILDITPGVCMVSVTAEKGSSKFRTKIDYDGKPLKMAINPEFLNQMLMHSTKISVTEGKVKLVTKDFILCTALYEHVKA